PHAKDDGGVREDVEGGGQQERPPDGRRKRPPAPHGVGKVVRLHLHPHPDGSGRGAGAEDAAQRLEPHQRPLSAAACTESAAAAAAARVSSSALKRGIAPASGAAPRPPCPPPGT